MDTPALRLLVLPISPWSERARWALDHHGLAYERQVHVPFLGERRLRRLVGPGPGRATVPVLVAGDRVLKESWDIARYADEVGQGAPLFPAGREAEIRRWAQLADEVMGMGRGLVTFRMLESPEALDETLPPAVPALVRWLLRPVSRYATRWFANKYGLTSAALPEQAQRVREGLAQIRESLGGRPYLLDGFSYADIVLATSLQGVSPVGDEHWRLGPATRAAWTQPELAASFADLIAWRDQIYARHRRR